MRGGIQVGRYRKDNERRENHFVPLLCKGRRSRRLFFFIEQKLCKDTIKKKYKKNCNEKHTRKWDKVEKSPLPNSRFILQVEQKEKTKAMKNFK